MWWGSSFWWAVWWTARGKASSLVFPLCDSCYPWNVWVETDFKASAADVGVSHLSPSSGWKISPGPWADYYLPRRLLSWSEVSEVAQSCVTPWTPAYQAPPSMGFSRQEYWSGLPFPSLGDLLDPRIEPGSPALWADALWSEPPGKPLYQEAKPKNSRNSRYTWPLVESSEHQTLIIPIMHLEEKPENS